MKTLSIDLTEKNLDKSIQEIKSINPSFICMFFSSEHAKKESLLSSITSNFSNIPVIGCSTAGEILDNSLSDTAVSLMAIHFDNTEVKSTRSKVSNASESYEAACSMGNNLKSDDLAAVLVLSPGLTINGSDVARGLANTLGSKVVVFGGLAGDGAAFTQTYTLLNSSPNTNELVALGFYGDHVRVKTGSKGGWSPFGPARRVTKVDNNILYELDDKPALDLYKAYLGEKADDLPASGLLYPFAILAEDQSQIGLIRTILNVNHEDKSLILAGNLEQGSLVGLMHADTDGLIDGATEAAEEACLENSGDSAAFLVSCVGRKIVLGDDVEEEVEAVKLVLGKNTRISGFYSYGEISPFSTTNRAELHNQTMTIAHISEI